MKSRIQNILPYFILALAVGFNLYFLYPELGIRADLNDNVFAFALVNRANDIVQNCSLINPNCFIKLLDHWVSYWAMGYPLPHFYQHWPSILVIVLTKVFAPLTGISLFNVFNIVKYLLYAAFPLSVYYSGRKFGFPKLASALSAFLASLISTNYQYGTDYGATLWRGSGMNTQLWGMVFLPLAVSSIFSVLKNYRFNVSDVRNLGNLGDLIRHLIPAILFLTLTFHAHLLFGYIAIFSTLFIPFIFAFSSLSLGHLSNLNDLSNVLKKFIQTLLPYLLTLLVIFSFTFLLLSYWIIPLMLNNDLHAHSVWDDYWKFNSFGARTVLERWFSGEMFDFNRIPVITMLVFTGFFGGLISYLSNLRNIGNLGKLPVRRSLDEGKATGEKTSFLFFPFLLIFWTLLYFGRETWGKLIDILPMAEGIHMHRFINGIHFAGIFLGGIGIYWVLKTIQNVKPFLENKLSDFGFSSKFYTNIMYVLSLIVLVIILSPVMKERVEFLNHNTYLINYNNGAFTKDMKDFQPILNKLTDLQKDKPGRIYAGRPGNWGRDFKVGMVSVFLTLSVRGYDTLGFEPESWSPNTDFEQFFDDGRIDHYNLFNIRYIIAPKTQKVPDFANKELINGNYALYSIETNGNFDAISVPYLLKTDKQAILNYIHMWLWSKWPSVNNHMIITYETPPTHNKTIDQISPNKITTLKGLDWSNYQVNDKEYNLFSYNPFESTPSSVTKVKFSNEKVTLDQYSVNIDTPQDTLVMLKITFHPFWVPTVDQKPAVMYMVSPAYMAIGVPKGTHTISFIYQIADYKKILILVSSVTFFFLIFFLVKNLKNRRSS